MRCELRGRGQSSSPLSFALPLLDALPDGFQDLPRPLLAGTAFKPKLGPSREEGDAGAQTGNTVRASLLQRPDPELGVRVYSLALLAARARAHKAPTSSQRHNTHALLAAMPAATTPIALVLALV